MFFVGDFGQLPPVSDLLMYSEDTERGGELSKKGIQTWKSFTHSVQLSQNQRQKGSSDEAAKFREALRALRCGELTRPQYEFLKTRGDAYLSPEELQKFDDAVYLVATHEIEHEHNMQKLKELGAAVFRIPATHTGGKRAATASDEDAGGLAPVLKLAEGAKVLRAGSSLKEVHDTATSIDVVRYGHSR